MGLRTPFEEAERIGLVNRAVFDQALASEVARSKRHGHELVMAFVEVDEKGTTAAAVTSVEVGVTSAPPMLTADRPFLFAIRERLSGTILFVGMVHDPTAD